MDADSQVEARAAAAAEVLRYRAGDVAAGDALALRALRLSLRTAAALTRGQEEAEDVAQDVALDVLRSLTGLRDPEAFDAWVHRITVRHALRRLKKRRRARESESPLALLSEEAHPAVLRSIDLDSELAARQALVAALSRLPAKQRLALALRYVHDLSDAEIAAALRCRPGTVHALLSRGRESLRADRQLVEVTLDLKEG